MSYRVLEHEGALTTCSACKNKSKQATCELYLKASFTDWCMFRKESGACDWHPDYACVKKAPYRPAVPAKSETSWPSKEELAERQQAIIDSTTMGI